MKFQELTFEPHPILPGAKLAQVTFPNGVFVTIGGGPRMYGDGEKTFEVAARQTRDAKKLMKLGEYDDILSWQSVEEVEIALQLLEHLRVEFL